MISVLRSTCASKEVSVQLGELAMEFSKDHGPKGVPAYWYRGPKDVPAYWYRLATGYKLMIRTERRLIGDTRSIRPGNPI